MKIILLLCSLFLGSLAFAGTPIITVGDVADPDCDFTNLQVAVDSINSPTEVHVSNSITTTTGISITDIPLTKLIGGYSSCADTTPNVNDWHSISNNGDTGLTIRVTDANISAMEISGFTVHDSTNGIQITNGGSDNVFTLTLHDIEIHHNSQPGINQYGTVNGIGLTLNLNNANIHHNVNLIGGGTQGGGIRSIDSNLNILSNVAIHDNQADNGAGVYAVRSSILFQAGGYDLNGAIEFGVFNNQAGFGGGFYLYRSDLTGTTPAIYFPLIISNNSAITSNFSKGGGIFFTNDSHISLNNVHLNHNTTNVSGAAIYGSGVTSNIHITRTANCQYSDYNFNGICSQINANQALVYGEGAAIYLVDASANINQVEIANNQGDHSIFYFSGASSVQFDANTMHGNSANDMINYNPNLITLDSGAGFYASYNTYADNLVALLFNPLYTNNTPDYLNLYKEVIANSPATIIDMNGGENDHEVLLDCSIIHDNSYGIISSHSDNEVAIPLFNSTNDYRLRFNSAGVNKNCSIAQPPVLSNFDIRGYDRTSDGQSDAGAFEYNDADDIIYKNSFEGTL